MRTTVAACRAAAAYHWSLTSRCTTPGLTCCRWSGRKALSTTSRHDESPLWPSSVRSRKPLTTAQFPDASVTRSHFSSGAGLDFDESTIYALSSAPGRSAIAVIRISGSACLDIYRLLCPGKALPKPRTAAVRSLYGPGKDASKESMLDPSALVLYFPAPKTVTGADILELHVHGGPAIVKAVLAAIARCGNDFPKDIRYAEPGEFTRRAFMNNRLDLTQVEALGDILSADTEQQRRLSVRGTTGALAKQYAQWRQQLLYARGELEALIDFSEDQHFDESPAELCASVAAQVHILKGALQVHSQNAVRGELLRHGISVALLGAPNAGKSSLLNRIIGREAAIVSQQAGTTRDVVEIGLDLGGYFCRFGDTAGLRQAATSALTSPQNPEVINDIEIEGMRRAKARAAESDLVIIVLSFDTNNEGHTNLSFDPEVCALARELIESKNNIMVAINKSDLSSTNNENATEAVLHEFPNLDRASIHMISCKAAQQTTAPGPSDPGGIQAFLQGLIGQFRRLTAALTRADASDPDLSIWQESLGASERHRVLLENCVGHLDAFVAEVEGARDDGERPAVDAQAEADIVVAAEHLRAAAECLAKITGKGEAGDVEEVLGVVFEKFCVGK